MSLDIIDIRRLFRNRFECYMDNNDSTGTGFLDGSSLTFRDACRILASDAEPFPRRYSLDMKKLCGHEYLTWFREDRSYGDVTRIFARLFAAEDGLQPTVGGRWVQEVLSNPQALDFSLRPDKELANTLG